MLTAALSFQVLPTGSSPRGNRTYARRSKGQDIDKTGVFTLRHGVRLHHIGVGRGHRGRPLIVLVCDLDIRVLSEDGELLRHLTLDPSKDYQPITARP